MHRNKTMRGEYLETRQGVQRTAMVICEKMEDRDNHRKCKRSWMYQRYCDRMGTLCTAQDTFIHLDFLSLSTVTWAIKSVRNVSRHSSRYPVPAPCSVPIFLLQASFRVFLRSFQRTDGSYCTWYRTSTEP